MTSSARSTRSRVPSASLPESELALELGRIVRAAQAEWRIPSVSAAVFRDKEVVWADALGLADVEAARAATVDTQYRIGSITKTFTAVAVLKLRDAGALALDDPLDRHVPGVPHGSVTLRRLLAHRSGLQREPVGEIWETLEPPDRERFLAELGDAEQVLPAGAAWHYSNLGFALLGEVVARVAGMPYDRYLEERVLGPLGLGRTTWEAVPPAARGYFVRPYDGTAELQREVDLSGTRSAGQLWSTTGDLARWASFLCDPDPAVLAPGTAAEMHELEAMMDVERWTIGWGLGLELVRRGDRVWAGHGGAMPGHLTGFLFRQREHVGAVVLTNAGAGTDAVELALRLGEKALELGPPESGVWRPAPEPPAEVQALLGRWWSEGSEFVFEWRDGRLEARNLDVAEYRQLSVFGPDGPDRYRVVSGRERGEVLRIVRDDAGQVVKLYWATYPFTRAPSAFG
jgi:CubicO group peptidase (beta-lactamase class C family)